MFGEETLTSAHTHKLEILRKLNQNRTKINPKAVPNRSQIDPRSVPNGSKIGPKSVQGPPSLPRPFLVRFWRHFRPNLGPSWGPSWGHVGAMLAIKSFFGGPGGRAKTTRKFDTCLNRFGSDFGTIWGGKMEPKSIQDRSQERSWSKCKNLQKSFVFIAFLKIQRFENRPQIVSQTILRWDAKATPKNVEKKGLTWFQKWV